MRLRQQFNDDEMRVEVSTVGGTSPRYVTTRPGHTIRYGVEKQLGVALRPWHSLTMGDQEMDLDETFEWNGIDDGARITLHTHRKSARDIVLETSKLNHWSEEQTEEMLSHVDSNNPYRMRWKWTILSEGLPVDFGHIEISGDLDMENSLLKALPESFGFLKVDGSVILRENQLRSLPQSFWSLEMGGDLVLGDNQLETLPKGCPHFTNRFNPNGNSIYLDNNRLSALPDDFGSLPPIAGDLEIGVNNLTELPDGFGNLVIRGSLYLNDNDFRSLSKLLSSIESCTVGKTIFVMDNKFSVYKNRSDTLVAAFGRDKWIGVDRCCGTWDDTKIRLYDDDDY